jgi:hypothetical protein
MIVQSKQWRRRGDYRAYPVLVKASRTAARSGSAHHLGPFLKTAIRSFGELAIEPANVLEATQAACPRRCATRNLGTMTVLRKFNATMAKPRPNDPGASGRGK